MTKNIRADIRAMLAAHGVKPAMLDMGTNATVQIFRTWLLEHASDHRGNAETAETVTLRSLETIFAEQVEKLAKSLRPERVDICKDPTTSEILNPNPMVPSRQSL
jgi:hypothetical protein